MKRPGALAQGVSGDSFSQVMVSTDDGRLDDMAEEKTAKSNGLVGRYASGTLRTLGTAMELCRRNIDTK